MASGIFNLKQVYCRFWRLLGVPFQNEEVFMGSLVLISLWTHVAAGSICSVSRSCLPWRVVVGASNSWRRSCTPCIMQGIQKKIPRKHGALENKCSVQNSNYSRKNCLLSRNLVLTVVVNKPVIETCQGGTRYSQYIETKVPGI